MHFSPEGLDYVGINTVNTTIFDLRFLIRMHWILSETVRDFIFQGVAICDIQDEKGNNETKQLEKEFGKDRAMFIKTDVSKEDEVEGLLHDYVHCAVLLFRYKFFKNVSWY